MAHRCPRGVAVDSWTLVSLVALSHVCYSYTHLYVHAYKAYGGQLPVSLTQTIVQSARNRLS